MADGGHKTGSNILTGVIGVLLLLLGIVISNGITVDPQRYSVIVNAGACFLFGCILLWWVIGEKKNWGIGFESVTMTVAAVTAVIAILTLTQAHP